MSREGRRRRIALAITLLPILVLTLSPGPAAPREPISVWCVVCGWRGASDALLNVALFVPFGIALGALGLPARVALVVGCVSSIGIELAQFVVPNRYPGLGDVIYNGLGACFGVLLYTWRYRLLDPADRLAARRRTWTWGALGTLGLVSQAWLLGPAIADPGPRLVFTPVTDWGTRYGGRVLELRVDGRALAEGDLPDGESLARIDEGAEIDVLVEAGPPSEGIVPLAVLDRGAGGEELFAIVLDHLDIAVRYRTNGMALRLDRPLARWYRGAAAWAEGDTIALRVRAIGDGIVVDHEGATAAPGLPAAPGPHELRVSTGRGWGFLMFPRFLARRPPTPVDFAWMLLIATPLGIWGAPRAATVCSLAWIGVLQGLPTLSPLVAGSTAGSVGVLAGVLMGLLLRLIHENPEPFKWWKPLSSLYGPADGSDDLASPSETPLGERVVE